MWCRYEKLCHFVFSLCWIVSSLIWLITTLNPLSLALHKRGTTDIKNHKDQIKFFIYVDWFYGLGQSIYRIIFTTRRAKKFSSCTQNGVFFLNWQLRKRHHFWCSSNKFSARRDFQLPFYKLFWSFNLLNYPKNFIKNQLTWIFTAVCKDLI